jgi:hypothetical protein
VATDHGKFTLSTRSDSKAHLTNHSVTPLLLGEHGETHLNPIRNGHSALCYRSWLSLLNFRPLLGHFLAVTVVECVPYFSMTITRTVET